MINMQQIMYPTDFSELSQAAVPYVISLADQFEAQIHCVHVVDESYQYWMGAGESAVPIVMSQEELCKNAQKHMDSFVERNFAGQKDKLKPVLITGRPFVEIIRYAREHQIDLLVIATHGHGGLASVLLGSVTEKVVRKAPCPVMTVRHRDHKFEMP